ncbi:hypothetical protein JKP88DRAFT_253549 [Tribonema minus]|uniref:Uncharacterized protein n=1 Tax=Tribonema minus TaxID=303371 RepID=A0A835Z9T7_9STRA|nr:hypothetical protein JKP88DRAFT_253549 [Tribonema minus]
MSRRRTCRQRQRRTSPDAANGRPLTLFQTPPTLRTSNRTSTFTLTPNPAAAAAAAAGKGKGKAKAAAQPRKKRAKVSHGSDDSGDDEGLAALGRVSDDELKSLSSNVVIPRARRRAAIQAERLTAIEIRQGGAAAGDDDDDDDDDLDLGGGGGGGGSAMAAAAAGDDDDEEAEAEF